MFWLRQASYSYCVDRWVGGWVGKWIGGWVGGWVGDLLLDVLAAPGFIFLLCGEVGGWVGGGEGEGDLNEVLYARGRRKRWFK